MLLLAVALSFYFWFRCMPVSPSHPIKRLIAKFENLLLQHRAWHIVQLTWWEAVQFVVLDVVYYVYSQVSDILVIHQLLKADNKYGYVLLGVLLLYILVMAVVTWTRQG